MNLRMLGVILAIVGGSVWAGFDYYAPDLRWDETARAYLGFVNPGREPLVVRIVGYDAEGAALDEREVELPRFGRFESAARDLFEDGAVRWARLDASAQIAGYVRYVAADKSRWSLVPLNRFAGDELWIPQLEALPALGDVEIALANAGAEAAAVSLNPFRDARYVGTLQEAAGPRTVPELTQPGRATRLNYAALYSEPFAHAFTWDRLAAPAPAGLVGALHFGAASGEGLAPLATVALPRTPLRDMALIPLTAEADDLRNELVLINVTPGPLEALVAFYNGREETLETRITLPARERTTVRFNELFPFDQFFEPQWHRVTVNETGLIGYQLSVAEATGAATALAGALDPGSLVSLPYTPTQDGLETLVTLLNPAEKPARLYVYGFDDAGALAARVPPFYVKPRSKAAYSMTELFGEAAGKVSWTRVLTTSGQAAAYSMTRQTGGQAMAAMQGQVAAGRDRDFFQADFEFIDFERLIDQGWTVDYFGFDFPRTLFEDRKDFYVDIHQQPLWGQIFTEVAFEAATGGVYLGYESPAPFTFYLAQSLRDALTFRSPFFEAPEGGPLYLSFALRMINPENANPGGRYGVAWREEGSSQWRWFGLSGEILQNPPLAVRDCWQENVAYRELTNLVTLTGWLPFEAALPKEAAGKRLQVALFYDHVYNQGDGQGPRLFIDDLRVSTNPRDYSLFYESASGEFERQD